MNGLISSGGTELFSAVQAADADSPVALNLDESTFTDSSMTDGVQVTGNEAVPLNNLLLEEQTASVA